MIYTWDKQGYLQETCTSSQYDICAAQYKLHPYVGPSPWSTSTNKRNNCSLLQNVAIRICDEEGIHFKVGQLQRVPYEGFAIWGLIQWWSLGLIIRDRDRDRDRIIQDQYRDRDLTIRDRDHPFRDRDLSNPRPRPRPRPNIFIVEYFSTRKTSFSH